MTDRARQLALAERARAVLLARENLLPFIRFTMPDPDAPDDVHRSRYEETPVARLLTQVMEKVFRRELRRVAISIGPQMGKSEITSRRGPAWMIGKDPYLNIILGTYNQDFASDFGDNVRDILKSTEAVQVFGEGVLRVGGKAKDHLITPAGGQASFVGRGGSGTGKPADIFIVDDPLKDDLEAQSDTLREQVWQWFNKVALTRCHTKSSIVIVHTRWHQDDLIGRLCDPEHPEREKRFKGIAKRWTYINLPAVVDDPKLAKALGLTLEPPRDPFVVSMFGDKPIASIWPGRKSLEFLAEVKQQDPGAFSALNMGAPTPEDGDYFKAEWLSTYEREDLPKNLVYYGASDHALGQKQKGDLTCMGCVGIDEDSDIWVLPDLVWDRMQTDRTVQEMISQIQQHDPMCWWLEGDLISKSFGPFLIQEMKKQGVFCPLDEIPTVGNDKVARARAIQGRMSQRTVHFPAFAPWWQSARKELLNFPNGAHDDFCDFMGHIGQGLLKQYAARKPKMPENTGAVGSIRWILNQTTRHANDGKRKASGGW